MPIIIAVLSATIVVSVIGGVYGNQAEIFHSMHVSTSAADDVRIRDITDPLTVVTNGTGGFTNLEGV